MRIPKFYLPLFCSVFFLKVLVAQNNLSAGYYVGFKKDTVHGFFDLEDLAVNKVDFYPNKNTSAPKQLLPENVSQIETLDSVSVRSYIYSYKDQKQTLFITKFVSGNVSFYKGYSSNPDETEIFLISSNKLPLIRKISKNNPKEFLNTYFKGCELGANYTIKYAQNSLLAAITEISKCAYPTAKIEQIARKHRPIRVELGAKAGLFVNKSEIINWLGERKSNASVKPMLGFILGLDLSNKVKFYTGINSFTRQFINTDPAGRYCLFIRGCKTIYPINMSTNFVEIPLAMHIEFNQNRPTYIPKLILGGSLLNPTNFQSNDDNKVKSNETLYETGTINHSFFIGGGVKRLLKNYSVIELQVKYSYEVENPVSLATINSNRIELSFNYLFTGFSKQK
jgi:hypothetical protein